jgi:hypothetical protein
MKATINVINHAVKGESFQVTSFTHEKSAALNINGEVELFELSEITLIPGTSKIELFDAGKALSEFISGFRNGEIHDAAKECAKSFGLSTNYCRKALYAYKS